MDVQRGVRAGNLLTKAALAAAASNAEKEAKVKAARGEDGHDDAAQYEATLRTEVSQLRKALEVKISQSTSSNGSNRSVEIAKAILTTGQVPGGSGGSLVAGGVVPPGVGMKGSPSPTKRPTVPAEDEEGVEEEYEDDD